MADIPKITSELEESNYACSLKLALDAIPGLEQRAVLLWNVREQNRKDRLTKPNLPQIDYRFRDITYGRNYLGSSDVGSTVWVGGTEVYRDILDMDTMKRRVTTPTACPK